MDQLQNDRLAAFWRPVPSCTGILLHTPGRLRVMEVHPAKTKPIKPEPLAPKPTTYKALAPSAYKQQTEGLKE